MLGADPAPLASLPEPVPVSALPGDDPGECVRQIGRATLYLGDCLAIMPTLEPVDHIIGDPPYEDELHKGAKEQRIIRRDGGKMHGDLGFEGINATRSDVARMCVEKSNGWLILFTLAEGVRAWRDEIQAAGGKYDTCLAWVKPDASPRFNGQGAARGFECAVTAWCAPGYRSWNGGGKRGIYNYPCNPSDRTGEHPTEKPRLLMSALVTDYTQPGQTILDPYMGSGTTGVAAVMARRNFIGIERDEKHFALACRRIEDAQRQHSLFDEVAA
jgi:site-specific DNA-methyltransferase (adenine-specific)